MSFNIADSLIFWLLPGDGIVCKCRHDATYNVNPWNWQFNQHRDQQEKNVKSRKSAFSVIHIHCKNVIYGYTMPLSHPVRVFAHISPVVVDDDDDPLTIERANLKRVIFLFANHHNYGSLLRFNSFCNGFPFDDEQYHNSVAYLLIFLVRQFNIVWLQQTHLVFHNEMYTVFYLFYRDCVVCVCLCESAYVRREKMRRVFAVNTDHTGNWICTNGLWIQIKMKCAHTKEIEGNLIFLISNILFRQYLRQEMRTPNTHLKILNNKEKKRILLKDLKEMMSAKVAKMNIYSFNNWMNFSKRWWN